MTTQNEFDWLIHSVTFMMLWGGGGWKTALKVSVAGFSFTSFLSAKKKKGLSRKGKA